MWRAHEHLEAGVRVLRLEGELDLSVAAEFERDLGDALGRASDAVSVDLTDVTYLDSASVRALLRVAGAASDAGKNFRVTGASGVTRRVLELTGVDGLLGLEPQVDTS